MNSVKEGSEPDAKFIIYRYSYNFGEVTYLQNLKTNPVSDNLSEIEYKLRNYSVNNNFKRSPLISNQFNSTYGYKDTDEDVAHVFINI